MFELGGAILVGGHSKEALLDDIYRLKNKNGNLKWTKDSRKLPEPRRSHSAVLAPLRFCQGKFIHNTEILTVIQLCFD